MLGANGVQSLEARCDRKALPGPRAATWSIADAGDNLLPTDQGVAAGLLRVAAVMVMARHSVRRRQRYDDLRKDGG